MRIRNLKNKDEILENCSFLITKPDEYKGKWKKEFNNNNPIYSEIGTGKGKFITEMALNNPNINFIGIEKYDSIIARAVSRVTSPLLNLRFIRADATNIDLFFDKEISLIYLNFSDPWPKKRHARRRLTAKNFLEKYDGIFAADKVIKLKTDNELLYSSSIVSLSEYGYVFKEISLDLLNTEIPNITTEYETKFNKKGIKIKYLEAIKK